MYPAGNSLVNHTEPQTPKIRVTKAPPFTITGVDFTGAFFVKEGKQEKKGYICLFTCAVTREVYLEVVGDLTIEMFLLAFRKFPVESYCHVTWFRIMHPPIFLPRRQYRNCCNQKPWKEFWNARTLYGSLFPNEPWGLLGKNDWTYEVCSEEDIRASPHLKEQLEIFVVEVEAMLNDRPLTYVSSDLTDPELLTSYLLHSRGM